MPKLAINGGEKIRYKNFPSYDVIGLDEKNAVMEVFESGIFSKFLGTWHQDFYGGFQVQSLEKEWSEFFGVKHAITVNSATSGLFCAVGASGIGPGDEVIVSPYTMSASAIAPIIYNAIPVFADIDENFFCLDPKSVEEKITKKTKAIIVVDIFGHPYDSDAINLIAKKHNLIVIEDCAQAPGAKYKDKYAGTLGDIGIFSLNYHKHIHCGEGGVIVTNNDEIAERLRLIRNHAEAVVEGKGHSDLINMIGFNYRMNEIEAAISRQQLKKLEKLVNERIENVDYLNSLLSRMEFLELPRVREGVKHSYYLHAIKFNEHKAGISREKFIEAVKAELTPIEKRESEGVKIGCGYVKPLYLQPMYQNKIAYGKNGCPWACNNSNIVYNKGMCRNAEKMHFKELVTHELMRPGMSKEDIEDVYLAFKKVAENINEIVKL